MSLAGKQASKNNQRISDAGRLKGRKGQMDANKRLLGL